MNLEAFKELKIQNTKNCRNCLHGGAKVFENKTIWCKLHQRYVKYC